MGVIPVVLRKFSESMELPEYAFTISCNGPLLLEVAQTEGSVNSLLVQIPSALVTSLIWDGHRPTATKWSFLLASA